MNTPYRYELYVLDDGEKAVEITEDTKIPNAATVKVVKQDHTLGNMLRAQLLAMPEVLFAGYKVPHPLQPYFIIKVQTDGTATPQKVVEDACSKLIAMIDSLSSKFTREFSFRDVDLGPAAGSTLGAIGDDPYGAGQGSTWGGKDYLDM